MAGRIVAVCVSLNKGERKTPVAAVEMRPAHAGDCVMPKEGLFARVLEGGVVRPAATLMILAP